MTQWIDNDELLDEKAQGYLPDDDDAVDAEEPEDEIAAMGEAAGLVIPDDKALGGADPIEHRDAKRWENNPASADDAEERDLDA